jgi:hypothetical protein
MADYRCDSRFDLVKEEGFYYKPYIPEWCTLAIKDQLRHIDVETAVDFYIGSHVDYQGR